MLWLPQPHSALTASLSFHSWRSNHCPSQALISRSLQCTLATLCCPAMCWVMQICLGTLRSCVALEPCGAFEPLESSRTNLLLFVRH